MLRVNRPPVSRVRGAACNGINHAGESPAAAIARFGCVAVRDIDSGRPLTMQAHVKVLGAAVIGPTCQEGERILGPQRERTPCEASKRLPTRNRSWGIEQPSPSRNGEGQWATVKVTGQSNRRLLRRIGGGTKRMGDDPKQGRSSDREADGTSREARPEEIARLADRVVVAEMLRDNITPAEQRTRGAATCSTTRRRTRNVRPGVGLTGDPRRVAKASTDGASNSLARKVASDRNVRSRCLEAVLGKTRRTEFQRGDGKRKLRATLNGHEAGNGGHSQAETYEPPRPPSTQQIRMHGLKGGLALFRPARVGKG
jgi:hypothetical protein